MGDGEEEPVCGSSSKCVPRTLHLTAGEEEGRQREYDDTLWRNYVDHKGRREGTRERVPNRTILYRAKCIYRATVSVPLC